MGAVFVRQAHVPACAQFDAAAASVKTFVPTKTVPDADKLKVYGLFKQATVGDCNTAR